MSGPVREFVERGRVVRSGVGEELALGKLNAVLGRVVERGEPAPCSICAPESATSFSGAWSGVHGEAPAAGSCNRAGRPSTCAMLNTVKDRRNGTTRGAGVFSSESDADSSGRL